MLPPPDEDDATVIQVSRREPGRFAAIFDRHAVRTSRDSTSARRSASTGCVPAPCPTRTRKGTPTGSPPRSPRRRCAGAEAILLQAAEMARALPSTPPRPDQFIYTKTRYSDGGVREAWLSADGTHDGLVRQYGEELPLPGCRDGRSQMYVGTEPMTGQFEKCTSRPHGDAGVRRADPHLPRHDRGRQRRHRSRCRAGGRGHGRAAPLTPVAPG